MHAKYALIFIGGMASIAYVMWARMKSSVEKPYLDCENRLAWNHKIRAKRPTQINMVSIKFIYPIGVFLMIDLRLKIL